jgi:hypothetical protein
VLFRMTKRVRDWLKVADPNPLFYSDVQAHYHKEWYCNLLLIHRRKCLLFTHSTTLFSFLIAGVRQADARNFGDLFRSHAAAALVAEGITGGQIGYLIEAGPDQIVKAENRSVLGSMNDLARMCKFHADEVGSFERLNIDEINREMNVAPMSYIGMESASRMLKKLLKSVGVE